jgi:hypothetical protein
MGIIDKLKEIIQGVKEEKAVIEGEKSKDSYYSSKKKYFDEFEAIEAFQRSKEKLFDVNGWSEIPALANSTFELHSPLGSPLVTKKPKKGDFIKIDLAGLMPDNWVIVTEVKEGETFAEFTVQPSHDPNAERQEGITEHFFRKDARSTFRVERRGDLIIAEEIGRDEAINNQGEEAGNRKVLNTMIAEGGWVGFQKYQWETVTSFLVGDTGD